jgi:predicted Rossmann-fold nucleotide-binding protein
MAHIAVFCGAREDVDRHYITEAEGLGRIMTIGGHTLVYGG